MILFLQSRVTSQVNFGLKKYSFWPGMGINITNKEPTISINEIIAQYNKDHKTSLQPLTIEETLARTINKVEELIDDFQENGSDLFLKKYYNRWLHRFVSK